MPLKSSPIRTTEVCERIIKASAKHDVDPVAVVGLLALHALVEADFPLLKIWTKVVHEVRGMLTPADTMRLSGTPAE